MHQPVIEYGIAPGGAHPFTQAGADGEHDVRLVEQHRIGHIMPGKAEYPTV